MTGSAPLPFREAIGRALDERRANGGSLAVLHVDCGVIGRIDAVWGYPVGDAVRARLMASLRSDVLRPDDLIGELDRDGFACVLSVIEGPAVAYLAAQKILRALNVPLWVGDDEISANPAVGISLFPNNGSETDALLQRAKNAALVSRSAPGRIAEYDEGVADPVAAQLLAENRLRDAIREDALELVFRPQYDLRLGQVMGADTLLCWRGAGLDRVAAEDAYSAAESAGRIPDLVSSLLNRALRNISEMRYSGGLDLRIGVKLSARALLHPELPEIVERALGTWGRRPGSLILEVCDTEVLLREAQARETLLRLKELGVKLGLDDRRLALTALPDLSALPFLELQLDVTSVGELIVDSKPDRILKAYIDLARSLRLAVAAVGVADDAVAARLKELRCDYMQAEFRGPAVDPRAFVERYGFHED